MFHQPQAWLRINILLQAINPHFCSASNWLLGNLVHKGSCALHILLWSKFSAFTIIHLIWRKMSEDPPPPYWESSKADLGAGQQPPADLGGPPGDENPFFQPDWPNVKIRSLQMMAVKRQRLKPQCFFLFCQLSWPGEISCNLMESAGYQQQGAQNGFQVFLIFEITSRWIHCSYQNFDFSHQTSSA